MIRPALHAIIAAILAATALACSAATFAGEVVAVLDGDTVDVLVNRQTVRVRLAAIDAPEIRHGTRNPGQPFVQRSRQSLAGMVFHQNVIIDEEGTDQYGRAIGTIWEGNFNVNAEQVRRGMAWVYRHYSHDPKLLQMEQEARAERRGLWADPNHVPPWDYRHSR
ncbi:thermonuclease [Candidatus Burkholderia verschuerenii]|uniref:Thermonuclease n=1 Tax=Candidatus Burkholderia verschuerenii TaxID=242163 RepID=A0A0L0ME34_9BURK|nr:thermonuclease family protein [Candidatus Burkholderia verschuerenii]KND60573.1 thermonuclease [Candidatus Burkholderia verschuerenii]